MTELEQHVQNLMDAWGELAVVEALGKVSKTRFVYERMEAAAEDIRNNSEDEE